MAANSREADTPGAAPSPESRPGSSPGHRLGHRLIRHWALHALLVGLVAGVGAVVFNYLLHLVSHHVIQVWMGVKTPSGAQRIASDGAAAFHAYAPFMVVLLPAIGGLFSGILCYRWAPEAMGHGTDGAIHAFHRLKGMVRPAVPFVKFVATIFTLGFGGSGGVEGPIAQIGSGFGSQIGRKLGLSARRCRILLVAGMGAGIAAIFEAPLAATIFAGEILYRGADIDGEVLIPTAIASVISYSTYVSLLSAFSGVVRWSHLFQVPNWDFSSGTELLGYTALALVCALAGRLWIRTYYSVETLFHHLPAPPWVRPALGGLLTGLLAWATLEDNGTGVGAGVLSGGFGFLQLAIDTRLTIGFLTLLFLLKMLSTSFSIGSGGAGGIFGPSLVLGGLLGSAVGQGLQQLHPSLVVEPGSFTVIGMAALFGAAAHAPVCSVIMVAEITHSYGLLVPSIWTCTLAFVLIGRRSLYQRQVEHLEDSPAHRGEIKWNVLNDLHCSQHMKTEVATMRTTDDFETIQTTLLHHRYSKFPVLDPEGRLAGLISLNELKDFLDDPNLRELLIAADAMDPVEHTATPDLSLSEAFRRMNENEWNLLCVTEEKDPTRMLGVLSSREILIAYTHELSKRRRDWEEF